MKTPKKASTEWATWERFKPKILQGLSQNSIRTLNLVHAADPGFNNEVVRLLPINRSVRFIVFLKIHESDRPKMTLAELVSYLRVFQLPIVAARITKLKIQDCSLPFHVIPTLLWQFRNLRKLLLPAGSADPSSNWDEGQWEAIAAALLNHTSLQKLIIMHLTEFRKGKKLSFSPGDELTRALATIPTLRDYKQVGQAGNGKGLARTESVSFMLQRCQRLRRLRFAYVKLQGPEFKDISRLLKSCRLVDFRLEFASIGDDEVVAIAEGLKENHFLRFLSLKGNAIGSAGSTALKLVLETDATITHLDISGCRLSNADTIDWLSILYKNSTLIHLNLGSPVRFPRRDMRLFRETLEDALQVNMTIQRLENQRLYEGFSLSQAKTCELYFTLNQIGRGRLLQATGPVSRNDWVETLALSSGFDDLSVAYYLIRSNPLLCCE